MSYAAVMLLNEERPKLMPLVDSAHRITIEHGGRPFSGIAVVTATKGMPANQSLLPLRKRGIVRQVGAASKQGHRLGYELVDPPGVEKALSELGRSS